MGGAASDLSAVSGVIAPETADKEADRSAGQPRAALACETLGDRRRGSARGAHRRADEVRVALGQAVGLLAIADGRADR